VSPAIRGRGLRRRTFFIGSIAWLSFVGILLWVSSSLLEHGFREVESREFLELEDRVRDLVRKQLDQVAWKGRDWAEWDAADQWLRGGGTSFPEENLNDSALAILGESYLAYFHADGRPAAVLGFDASSRRPVVPDTNCLRGAIPAEGGGRVLGLFRCGDSLRMMSASPVGNSLGAGGSSGWFVVGHAVGRKQELELGALLGHPIAISTRMAGSDSVILRDSLAILRLGYPVSGQRVPAGLTVTVARPVRAVSLRIRRLMVLTLLAMAVGGTLLSLTILEIFVVRRILRLSREVVAHGDDPGLPARSFGDGEPDEIGALGEAIDGLVGSLVGIQDRLAQALDAAQEGTRAKSAFLASVSHDLRTPLNGMIGLNEFLLKTRLDEPQREAMDLLRSASENLLAMINDILEHSRSEAGRIELQPEDVSIEDVFHGPIRVLAPIAHHQGIDLTLRLDPDLPSRVHVDAARMRQILHNLVGNAVKFTERGEVSVSVLKVGSTDQATRLRVSVCDTGTGIPAGSLASIFDPFVQASPEIGKRQGGTGLGLSIARQMVERMGGTLQVRSQLGQGSEFFFEVEVPAIAGSRRLVPPRFRWAGRGPVAILVQRASLRASLVELVAALGLRPLEVPVPEGLPMLAEEGPVGLLLADVESLGAADLPGLAALRADPHLANVPLVVLSRTDRLQDDEICREHGVGTVLRRPVSPSRIVAAIERGLRPRLRVLVSVPSGFLAAMVEGMLRARGHAVVSAPDLSSVEPARPPDIVLLDGESPTFGESWRRAGALFPSARRVQLGGSGEEPGGARLERPFAAEAICELVEDLAAGRTDPAAGA